MADMGNSSSSLNEFLKVRCGELVVVRSNNSNKSWWMGQVIHVVPSPRSPEPSLFQISCLDTGIIQVINADMVIGRINTMKTL